MRSFSARNALLVAAVFWLQGCANLGYYVKAAATQSEVLERARPIPDVLVDASTPDWLRAKLSTAGRIRDFATASLALPDNASYRSYSDLGRRYAAWNVFAAPEFSLTPKEWCFVVAGCVSYRGYSSKENADGFANTLRDGGYDVFVTGVPAWSTLGWFDDPILNTFVRAPDRELAKLIFHELAHQVVYVKDDTPFNESFATAVELEGVRRWLAAEGRTDEIAELERSEEREKGFHALVKDWKPRLKEAYNSDVPPEEKRRQKTVLFDGLRAAYRSLRESWGGFPGYDNWFDGVNNARLSAVSTYEEFVPAFRELLSRTQENFPRFYEAVRDLAALPKEQRLARLAALRPWPPPAVATRAPDRGTESLR